MGMSFDIKMNFEHRDESMKDLLVNSGVAIIKEQPVRNSTEAKTYIEIDIQKLDPQLYEKMNSSKKAKLKECFSINYEDKYILKEGGLQYYSKWGLDETILNAISRYFKDDVIYVKAQNNSYPETYSYFVKNGEECLRDGTLIDAAISNVSTNLIKELQNGNVRVTLPIGEGIDRWGTFEVSKNNVELTKFKNWKGSMILDRPTILLKGDIEVQFENSKKVYTSKELSDVYFFSKSNYRNKMKEEIYIKGLNIDNLRKMGDEYNTYYIVNLPCKKEISYNEKISFTVPSSYIENIDNPNEMSIYIGQFGGTPKNVRIQDGNGNTIQKEMHPRDIIKYYKETLSTSQLENINENTNEEVDDDLER